jgi:hypothetical protein
VDRVGTGGYLIFFGEALISWQSKKLGRTGVSSAESEYMQLWPTVQEVLWLRKLLRDLGEEQVGATKIYCDSASAIAMASPDAPHHSKTKHIDVTFHAIRERVRDGEVEFLHVRGTDQMPADGLTKPLGPLQHSDLRSVMRGSYAHVFKDSP